ncbi:MAG: FG-GAP-like repeat-containing protein, partial [Flavobacteriales bacterium]
MTNKILQEGFKPSFFPFGKIATALLLVFVSIQPLHAQWLEWSDESSTRLVVSSVAVSDDEEKDMWAADLNNDGHEDIIVVRKEPFSNPIEPAKSDLLLMNVNGILTDMTSVYAPQFISSPTYARDVFIADFNNDGWQDVVVANTFGMQPVFYQNQGEDVNGNWLGLLDETASRFPDLTDDVTLICAVWGGDVTGDGAPDIYFANYKQGGTALDFLLINDGSGHFTNESQARLGNLRNSAFGTAVQIHDMDNDGDNDIIKVTTLYSVSPWNSLGTILMFNNGNGTFTNWQNLTPSAAPYMFDVADFNLDGQKDLYVVDDGSDRLLTVTGFTVNTSLSITQTSVNFGSVNGFGGNVHAMDIDLDGDMDIAVSDVDVDIPPCDSGRRLALLRNDGGTFTNPYGTTLYPWADNSYDMVWIDINEDGLPDFVTGKCSGYGVFMSDNCGLAPNPSDYDEDGLADTCDPCPTNPDPNCAPPTDYPTTSLDNSAARQWNELLLASIRRDFARPPVHARNLFHFSVAAYDSWAAYEPSNCTFLLGQTVDGFSCAFSGITAPPDIEAARAITISYASYRLLRNRFGNSPNAALLYQGYDAHMAALGLDINFTSTDYSTGSAAALGNYIAQCIIAFGMQDGSNQSGNYTNTSYTPINPPMIVDDPGNPNVVDINRWQPTTLDIFIDQSGNEIPGATPAFIGAQWGSVTPFSLQESDKTIHPRNGWNYEVYHDPGTPPMHSMDGSGTTPLFQWNFETVAMWSSHLDPTDGVMWDISPASRGNQNVLPTNLQDHVTFYDQENGGTVGSVGHPINPVTGLPYTPNIVPRGDYSRVLAEFWADGPSSETPPGHWFSIFNYVADHPLVEKKFKGEGPVLNDLEWDVKGYLAMGGAMHDVAITSWGIKGHYDYTRPVHALRAMADLGQCSDPLLPNYHPGGLHLIPGFIELVETGDPLAGAGNINVNKIKVKSWKGHDFINNVDTDEAGVGWILAEE